MLLAKQSTTLPAVNGGLTSAEGHWRGGDGAGAKGVCADIAVCGSLPVRAGNVFVWVSADGGGLVGGSMGGGAGGRVGGVVRGMGGVVGLEDIEAFKFLVEDGEGLELLGLVHLRLEPILDLVLLFDNQVLVRVVEVSSDSSSGLIG